jgi:hypothetical protein
MRAAKGRSKKQAILQNRAEQAGRKEEKKEEIRDKRLEIRGEEKGTENTSGTNAREIDTDRLESEAAD